MSFLEDLRRKNLAKEEALKRARSEEDLAEKIKREAETERNSRTFQQALQAKRCFNESGIKDLIDELQKIEKKRFKILMHPDELERRNQDIYTGPEQFEYRVTLSDTHLNGEFKFIEFFSIVATSDGTIRFSGDKKGSSTVPKNVWINNKSALEDALGKVYENPQKVKYPIIRDHHRI